MTDPKSGNSGSQTAPQPRGRLTQIEPILRVRWDHVPGARTLVARTRDLTKGGRWDQGAADSPLASSEDRRSAGRSGVGA